MTMLNRRALVTSLVSAASAPGSQTDSGVRFGIIGTGGRGQYVGTLMTKSARLTAICDRYADRIDAAKTKIPGAAQAKTYRDYQQLLADPEVDAVLIATPPSFCIPSISRRLSKRRNISTVKSPPALTWPAASAF